MTDECPRLRYLEALPHTQDGKTFVVLRDPLQITEATLIISPALYQILPLFNGANSLLDIQAVLTRSSGRIVFREELEKLLGRFDEALFLDNDHFKQHYEQVLRDFQSQNTRPCSHAGQSYPADPVKLTEAIDSFYLHEKGAGLPDSTKGAQTRAIVAPHIDFRLGGPTYTHAYRALAESGSYDLFVILGTGHLGLSKLFSISRKDFETPLGVAPVDREFVDTLDRHLKTEIFAEELTHRSEHTIEFQVVFLQHLFRNSGLRILPVLVSFSHLDIRRAGERAKLIEHFVEAMRAACMESGKRICFVASVDLAHIGPRYGDPFHPNDQTVREVSQKDLQMLEFVKSGDTRGFVDFVAREEDERRICGFSPLLTLLRLLAGCRGELLSHSYCWMDSMGSFVTYASMVFKDSSG